MEAPALNRMRRRCGRACRGCMLAHRLCCEQSQDGDVCRAETAADSNGLHRLSRRRGRWRLDGVGGGIHPPYRSRTKTISSGLPQAAGLSAALRSPLRGAASSRLGLRLVSHGSTSRTSRRVASRDRLTGASGGFGSERLAGLRWNTQVGAGAGQGRHRKPQPGRKAWTG